MLSPQVCNSYSSPSAFIPFADKDNADNTTVRVVGAIVLLIMVLVWRKIENKEPIKLSGKTISATLMGIAGALLLGVGMCLTMVWSHMVVGIIIGIVGIVILLCLVPFIRGLK